MKEKSTSKTLISGLKRLSTKCSPLTVQGLLSHARLTSASCLKENINIFLSTADTSTSFMTFQALINISLTSDSEKALLERILPIRSFFESSLEVGTTSRLIFLFSQLSLFACEVAVSTESSAMTEGIRKKNKGEKGL